jgi:predicted metal-dependent hydrolase
MSGEWPCCEEPLPEIVRHGLERFNAGEYFEQHEILEHVWRAERRPVREIYQGILQIGVACYQIQRGNYAGALKMLRRGLAHLRRAPDRCQGIDIARLREDAQRLLHELERRGPAGSSEPDPRWFLRVFFEG